MADSRAPREGDRGYAEDGAEQPQEVVLRQAGYVGHFIERGAATPVFDELPRQQNPPQQLHARRTPRDTGQRPSRKETQVLRYRPLEQEQRRLLDSLALDVAAPDELRERRHASLQPFADPKRDRQELRLHMARLAAR